MKCAQSSKLIERLNASGAASSIEVEIVTDLRPDSILAGILEVESLLAFARSTPKLKVTYLPNLHAKVYVTDSSNLTRKI